MTDSVVDGRVVPGEMTSWSDYDSSSGPFRGQVVSSWFSDLPGKWTSAIVVGPHSTDLIALVAERCQSVTVLVRSATDAAALTGATSSGVRVIAGALDGLLAEDPDVRFDLVVALDGLDRILSPDSPAMSWSRRLEKLLLLRADGGTLLLTMANEFSACNMLDARIDRLRHRDEEWTPIHSDPARPVSPKHLCDALQDSGCLVSRLWAGFGVASDPAALVEARVAAAASPQGFVLRLATQGARSTDRPLLAQPDEMLAAAAHAGLLANVAETWMVLCSESGGTSGRVSGPSEVYGCLPGEVLVAGDLRLEGTGGSWEFSTRTNRFPDEPLLSLSATGDSTAELEKREDRGSELELVGVAGTADVVPTYMPDWGTVEAELFVLAEREDVPAFRELAMRLGDWLRAQRTERANDRRVVLFDDAVTSAGSFELGASALIWTEPVDVDEQITLCWTRFRGRLLQGRRRHPWPPWVIEDGIMEIWLRMSGVEPSDALIDRGAVLLESLGLRIATPMVDDRSSLGSVDALTRELHEARGQIFGLERTIGYRDSSLRIRAKRIRSLHAELAEFKLFMARLDRLGGKRTVSATRLAMKASRVATRRDLLAGVKRIFRRRIRRLKSAIRRRLRLG